MMIFLPYRLLGRGKHKVVRTMNEFGVGAGEKKHTAHMNPGYLWRRLFFTTDLNIFILQLTSCHPSHQWFSTCEPSGGSNDLFTGVADIYIMILNSRKIIVIK